MKQSIQIRIAQIFMLIVLAILIGLISLCQTIKKIEEPAYNFYYNTKALIVVKRVGNKLYCKSPAGINFYRVTDMFNQVTSDTIILSQNRWVYAQTKFIKQIPE